MLDVKGSITLRSGRYNIAGSGRCSLSSGSTRKAAFRKSDSNPLPSTSVNVSRMPQVVQWLVETLPHAATALAAVLRSCLLTIHTRPTPPTAAPPATSIASGCAHPAEEEADGAALLASLQWVLWGAGMMPNVMDTSAPDLLYRAALHGFGMNRFVVRPLSPPYSTPKSTVRSPPSNTCCAVCRPLASFGHSP